MTASERRTIGGLEITERLSAGGVGEVFLAKRRGPQGFQKQVVVKTLRADLEDRDDLRRMFFDEARLVARLDHSAICQVYEFGEEAGTLFMVMEHVAGVTLGELIARLGGPCPPLIAARIGEEVLRGLHAAHEAKDEEGVPLGVVHRDVSPGNLMLTFRGRVKIVDFGIALMRGRNAPSTQIGTVRGKYGYIAPEQMRPGPIDRRADIYAMSVVLFELLSGRPLFSSHGRHAVAPASLVISPACEGLAELVARGLSLEPEGRFQTANEMADALAAIVSKYGGESLEQFAQRTLAEPRVERAPERGPTVVDGPTPAEEVADTVVPAKPPPRRPRYVLAAVLLAALVPIALWIAKRGAIVDAPRANAIEVEAKLVREEPVPALPERPPPDSERPSPISQRPSPISERPPSDSARPSPISERPPSDSARPPPDSERPSPISERPSPISERPPSDSARPSPVFEAPPSISERTAPGTEPKKRRPPAKKVAPVPAPVEVVTPAREPGSISVGADPYMIVVVDGVDLGLTPIIRHPISAGRHRIQFLEPANRSTVESRHVDIDPGEHERVLFKK